MSKNERVKKVQPDMDKGSSVIEAIGTPQDENLLVELAKIADSKKGVNIVLMDLRSVNSYLNYFILITANSALHAKSLGRDLHERIIKNNIKPSIDDSSAEWIIFDCFWFVIHIFQKETRNFYALDRLWADARKINWL